DVFVGPSKRAKSGGVEGQGLTFIEAMLAGTPVIATRSGGIPDAVRHEDTGLLVSENAPEEIAAAIGRLVRDPGLAQRLAAGAREMVMSEFSRETTAHAFSALFAARMRR
ncbi:MAG: glycosyltransferase family 4 protein, partial [Gammaproteobacteria bacterium]|nr:glycosyltransferase family 4 protein [Gammaproteobacteria bacterium]